MSQTGNHNCREPAIIVDAKQANLFAIASSGPPKKMWVQVWLHAGLPSVITAAIWGGPTDRILTHEVNTADLLCLHCFVPPRHASSFAIASGTTGGPYAEIGAPGTIFDAPLTLVETRLFKVELELDLCYYSGYTI